MPMSRDEAIERARKLMALGQSDNEHESAQAIGRAQALLERFEIELAELAVDPTSADDSEVIEASWKAGGQQNAVLWRMALAHGIALVNGCTTHRAGPRVHCTGRRIDVQRVAKLHAWIATEVERIAVRHCAGRGRAYANAFRNGCVSTVIAEMQAAQRRTRDEMRAAGSSETALVVVDKRAAVATAARDRRHPRLRSAGRRTVSSRSGYDAGRAAGAGLADRAGRGAIGGGRRQLPG